MRISEKIASANAEAQELLAVAEKGALTDEQSARLAELTTEVTGLKKQEEQYKESQAVFAGLGDPHKAAADAEEKEAAPTGGGSLGEIAVKSFRESGVLERVKDHRKASSDLMYSKAAGDPITTTSAVGTATSLLLPDIDKNIVKQNLQRLTIADWLGGGTISGNSITYFLEKAWDNSTHGAPGMVAESGKKPGVTAPEYEQKTIHLKKLAGWLTLTDEMAEDLPFLVSEINNRLLVQLAIAEENQLLNGDGTGNNLEGLLTRPGLLTEAPAKASDNVDSIYKAQNAVFLKTGLRADGLIINPADYQTLRLSKDANGQYFGGGPFTGQYGVGGIMQEPSLWGLNVIQTTAIPAGTALVGAGKTAATVYRKGALRVEASNNVNDDFLYNRFRVLAEERLALAVRMPGAFCKITLSNK